MRILCLCREKYPSNYWTSYVLFHQSMALEELGHEVHLFDPRRPPLRFRDYLDAFDFDLLLLDTTFLGSEALRRALTDFRRREPIRVVGALHEFADLPDSAWGLLDFAVTPWQGAKADELRQRVDLRYLPLGYSARLHSRRSDVPRLGPVFVGDTRAERSAEAAAYLDELSNERTVFCIGPAFDQKYLDPFMLGRVYAAARCLPNFHYSRALGENRMLNERFWQSAACGVPVNDRSPLVPTVWDAELEENFCFADRLAWQKRVRDLNTGKAKVTEELLARLDASLVGHSYTDRMKQLLEWLA